jgi:hypothetical protein
MATYKINQSFIVYLFTYFFLFLVICNDGTTRKMRYIIIIIFFFIVKERNKKVPVQHSCVIQTIFFYSSCISIALSHFIVQHKNVQMNSILVILMNVMIQRGIIYYLSVCLFVCMLVLRIEKNFDIFFFFSNIFLLIVN